MPGDSGTPLSRETPRREARLLLHVCCGPCAIMPILRCRDDGFSVTAWFLNPNIHPLTEYLRRREAARQACEILGVEFFAGDGSWNITDWLRAVAGMDAKPERCAFCCESRVRAAFLKALELNIPFFSTSLLYSRYQPHDVIAEEGRRMEAGNPGGPAFVYRDFRKDWHEGIERSKEMEIYRQAYCGCIFSEAERYAGRLLSAARA